MKLSCQEHLVPGDTFADRLANLAAWGYEGVELTGGDGRLLAREDEIKSALADSPIQASTICGGQTNQFIHRDQANRETSVRELRAALHLTAAVGAIGCIMVPAVQSRSAGAQSRTLRHHRAAATRPAGDDHAPSGTGGGRPGRVHPDRAADPLRIQLPPGLGRGRCDLR